MDIRRLSSTDIDSVLEAAALCDAAHRRQGIGRALCESPLETARERGCYGMWVPTDLDNEAAVATYRSAGADEPEAGVHDGVGPESMTEL